MGFTDSEPWIWNWVVAELVRPPACWLSLIHTTTASFPALLQLGHPWARGRVSSPAFMPSGLVHLGLSHAIKATSILLPRQDAGLALQDIAASGMSGIALQLSWPQDQLSLLLKVLGEGGGHHPLIHTTLCWMSGGAKSPMFLPLCHLSCDPSTSANSTMFLREVKRSHSPEWYSR